MPVKKRKIYHGTNRSNAIGPIGCPPFTAVEAHNIIAWKEKKEFYSASAKIACRVGGTGPPGSVEQDRKPESMEPVNLQNYVAAFWEEALHNHSVMATVDFTPGAGYLAEACMSEKIPYVGFIQTPTACRVVRRYLSMRTWDLMCKPGSAHYDASLRNLIVVASSGAPGGGAPNPAVAPTDKAAAAAHAGGAPQRTTTTTAESSSSSAGGGDGINPALLAALKSLEAPATKGKGKAKAKATMVKPKVEKDEEAEEEDSVSDVE